ncbi:transmembrane protein 256 homolog [Argiope bruennichi]|uniref:transmembrane protein 256 homolog n=1 Tax=Argiope bruennichi TaxID=94029 RepID=UPI002494AC55|nr:transmembrane protein 256 homolog [Argiope bruennichi]
MGYEKSLDYINPLKLWYFVQDKVVPNQSRKAISTQTTPVLPVGTMNLSRVAGHLFIKFAGVSGAAAVAMGAYGSHGFYPKADVPAELKDVFKTANYYHFLHTLALLAVPLTKRPNLVGSLLTTGMLIFCGTCYAYALTGNKSLIRFTPYGGSLLIIAWLSMVF